MRAGTVAAYREAEEGGDGLTLTQIQSIIEAIKDGLYQPSMKAEMERLEARKADVEQAIASADVSPPLLHPSLADVYRSKITALADALARDDTKAEAAEIVRSLVSKIDLTPEDGPSVPMIMRQIARAGLGLG